MDIDEAIRIKSLEGEEFLHTDPDKIDEAERLSVEALMLVNNLRFDGSPYYPHLLPGETRNRMVNPIGSEEINLCQEY